MYCFLCLAAVGCSVAVARELSQTQEALPLVVSRLCCLPHCQLLQRWLPNLLNTRCRWW